MNKNELTNRIDEVIKNYQNDNTLFCHFWNTLAKYSEFYIIGGAIRSIYNNSIPRDIDIIIKESSTKFVKSIDSGLIITRNYYGGYKIDFNGIVVDLWDFKNHWAFKRGLFPAGREYLVESCFFNYDSLVYSPVTKYINIDHYLTALETNKIDFIKNNVEYIKSNPGNLTNVIRALVAAKQFNLTFSDSVWDYIKSYVEKNDFNSINKCQLMHYKEEKISFQYYQKICESISES